MRRDGAVIDDAAASWTLGFHDLKSCLGAEKNAREVDIDDATPKVQRQILKRNAGAPMPALLKSRSSLPKVAFVASNSVRTDTGSLTSAATASACAGRACLGDCSLQRLDVTAGEHNGVPLLEQSERGCRPDPRPAPVTRAILPFVFIVQSPL